jgi:hypothetical protein
MASAVPHDLHLGPSLTPTPNVVIACERNPFLGARYRLLAQAFSWLGTVLPQIAV